MNWNESFLSAFRNKSAEETAGSAKAGFWLIVKAQRFRFYGKILWELFTTFVVYAPGTNLTRTILAGVDGRWDAWSEAQRRDVLCCLRKLDRKGEISKELEEQPGDGV